MGIMCDAICQCEDCAPELWMQKAKEAGGTVITPTGVLFDEFGPVLETESNSTEKHETLYSR